MDTFYAVRVEYERFPHQVMTLGSFRTIEEAITKMMWKVTYDDRFNVDHLWFDEFIDSSGEIVMKGDRPAILFNCITLNNKNNLWIEPINIPHSSEVNYMELLNILKKKHIGEVSATKKHKIGE